MIETRSAYDFSGDYISGDNILKNNFAGVLRMLGMLLLLVVSTGGQLARAQEVQMFKSSKVQRVEAALPEVPEVREVQVEPVEYVDTVLVRPIDRTTDWQDAAMANWADSLALDSVEVKRGKPFMALRTNLLYDAAVLPNIGLEVALGKGFTIGLDWFYTWIFTDPKHLYWQSYGGYLTARYYWGKAAAEQPFTGHHVGIYGLALTYDIEFGGIGYQAAQFGFGGGVEYGYSLRVARSLCIDFGIGLGYQGGEYKVYQPTDDGTGHYVWMSTHRRNWWGPTKAEISLKWLISSSKRKSGLKVKGEGFMVESTPPAQSATISVGLAPRQPSLFEVPSRGTSPSCLGEELNSSEGEKGGGR